MDLGQAGLLDFVFTPLLRQVGPKKEQLEKKVSILDTLVLHLNKIDQNVSLSLTACIDIILTISKDN